jgi:hypothetical protein
MSTDPFRDSLNPVDQGWLDAIREHNAVERAMRLEREAREARGQRARPRIRCSFLRDSMLGWLVFRLLGRTEENR